VRRQQLRGAQRVLNNAAQLILPGVSIPYLHSFA
jgi:hypothetical protein